MAAASTEKTSSGMEFVEHEKTYAGFLHLLKWFIIHLALDVVALYFLVIQASAGVGAVLLLVAFVALGYGIARTPSARRHAESHAKGH